MSLPWANADPGRFIAGNRAAEALQVMLNVLAVPYLSEKSAKCRPGHWSTQRCLFSVPVELVSPDTLVDALGHVLSELGMTDDDARECLAPLHDHLDDGRALPHFLHLGVEDDRCKIYWESPLPDPIPRDSRFVLYRAWKWRAGESVARSDYVLLPTAGEARQAIERELAEQPASPLHDVIEQLQISYALGQTSWPPLTVRVEEIQAGRATGRDSLNLHLHQADLPLGTLAGTLFSLTRDWRSAARETLVSWMARHGNETLSNLSFGCDRGGQSFLTCYHGTTRHHPTRTAQPRRSDRIPGSARHARQLTPQTV